MAGCFGNSTEDKMRERELYRYLDSMSDDSKRDERVEELANDKYMALADTYTTVSGRQISNFEDALQSITSQELTSIARLLRDKDFDAAGRMLAFAIQRVLSDEAEDEVE